MTTPYLDRIVTASTLGVSATFSAGVTTWTLPYSVAGDGSEGVLVVIDGTTGAVLPSARPALNQISVSGVNRVGAPIFIGLQYTTSYTLSTIFIRKEDGNGKPDHRGRLQVRYVFLQYEDSTDFTATVSAPGKTTRTYTFSSSTPKSGKFLIPIMEHNVDVTVTLSCTNGGAFGWSGYEWEGTLFARARLL
jgi:hypothetical protein